jgi:hypothetical protein
MASANIAGWSFACFADPLLRFQDLAELCAFLCLEERLRMPENTSDCANRARQLAMKLCLFVPAAKTVIVRNPFILLASPTGLEPVLPP